MRLKCFKCVSLLLVLLSAVPVFGQKLITYEAGMGTRDMNDPDTWVLYQRVRAQHDGMVFYADSALLNQERNDLTAFGHIKILVSDTTTIYGDQLYYDGESRVLDIWDDTVRLVDGKTVLKTDHLAYDRYAAMASYDSWGITVNGDKRLTSYIGNYSSDFKTFYIYDSVVLVDSNMRMVTDTLVYDMNAHLAEFWSPTYIYTDTSTLYSEAGRYNTDQRYAFSSKSSEVHNAEKHLYCDTLHYYEETEFGRAIGHVRILDTINDIISTSRYAETSQETHTSFVTDSALVRFVNHPEKDSAQTNSRTSTTQQCDTLYLHADSIIVVNDSARKFQSAIAHSHVKLFRGESQAMCDSAYYSAADSLLQMFGTPVVWYDHYQATADTIVVYHDSANARKALLSGNSLCVEQIDPDKFNQVQGRNTIVYFKKGDPDYADILGNAEMIYYITDEQVVGKPLLIGINVGKGSDMRVYFVDRAPDRVVTMGNPDMDTYPLDKLEAEKRRLSNFHWYDAQRPRKPMDVFLWTDR